MHRKLPPQYLKVKQGLQPTLNTYDFMNQFKHLLDQQLGQDVKCSIEVNIYLKSSGEKSIRRTGRNTETTIGLISSIGVRLAIFHPETTSLPCDDICLDTYM